MQQTSVERISTLIGAIYDCVIEPERWTGVLNEIRIEFRFATAVLSAYSLTNMRIGVNAASGTDPVQTMTRTSIEYAADIVELWGGVERIRQYPLGEPIIRSQAVPEEIILGNRYHQEWALPKGLFDAVGVALVRDKAMIGNATSVSISRPGPLTMRRSADCACSRLTSGAP